MLRTTRGFTLVEVLFVTLILSMIAAGALVAMADGTNSWQVGDARLELYGEGRALLSRVVYDLRQSGPSAAVLESPTRLSFAQSAGVDGSGNISWGGLITYDWNANTGVVTRTDPVSTTVVGSHVDSLIFTADSAASPTRVQITLQLGKTTAGGFPVAAAMSSSAALRN